MLYPNELRALRMSLLGRSLDECGVDCVLGSSCILKYTPVLRAAALHSPKLRPNKDILGLNFLPASFPFLAALSACRSVGPPSILMYVCIHCGSGCADVLHSPKLGHGKGILCLFLADSKTRNIPADCRSARPSNPRISLYTQPCANWIL